MNKVNLVITGGTSGLGLEAAKALAKRGFCTVYELSRRESSAIPACIICGRGRHGRGAVSGCGG